MRRLLAALLLLAAPRAMAGVILTASTDSLELVTSTAASIDYNCSWTDNTTTAFTPDSTKGNVASATTTTIVAAPGVSTQRSVQNCTFRNVSTTTSNVLTIQRDVSATNRLMYSATVGPGETLLFTGERFFRYSSAGNEIVTSSDSGYNGKTFNYSKAGTAKDSAGYWIMYAKDAGIPGAWVLGAPGVNGANFDCSTAAGAAVAGSPMIQNAASGNNYLTAVTLWNSVTESAQLIDLIWYNTGLVVTTTAIQNITTAAFPARDADGSTNGSGINMALYAVAALGNAAAVSNTTISYTDDQGNTGNTGTFQAQVGYQAPATPVIGTFMPFSLAAGDRGIRGMTGASGGGITLTTTYTSGTMSLLAYRPLVNIGTSVANVPTTITFPSPGIRLYPGTCLQVVSVGSATLGIVNASFTVIERP